MVVIDSVSAFDTERRDGAAIGDYLWGIADHFRRQGVTLILTTEAFSFFEGGNEPDRHMSYLADTVLLLRLVEVDDDVKRRISVMKMRGSQHDTRIRELLIGSDRVEVAPHD
jgi:circadian clock protein KaiC